MLPPRMKTDTDCLEGVWRWPSGRSSGKGTYRAQKQKGKRQLVLKVEDRGVAEVLVRVSGVHLGGRYGPSEGGRANGGVKN